MDEKNHVDDRSQERLYQTKFVRIGRYVSVSVCEKSCLRSTFMWYPDFIISLEWLKLGGKSSKLATTTSTALRR